MSEPEESITDIAPKHVGEFCLFDEKLGIEIGVPFAIGIVFFQGHPFFQYYIF